MYVCCRCCCARTKSKLAMRSLRGSTIPALKSAAETGLVAGSYICEEILCGDESMPYTTDEVCGVGCNGHVLIGCMHSIVIVSVLTRIYKHSVRNMNRCRAWGLYRNRLTECVGHRTELLYLLYYTCSAFFCIRIFSASTRRSLVNLCATKLSCMFVLYFVLVANVNEARNRAEQVSCFVVSTLQRSGSREQMEEQSLWPKEDLPRDRHPPARPPKTQRPSGALTHTNTHTNTHTHTNSIIHPLFPTSQLQINKRSQGPWHATAPKVALAVAQDDGALAVRVAHVLTQTDTRTLAAAAHTLTLALAL